MPASVSRFKQIPVLRKVTAKLISIDPRTISLIPHVKTRQPSGGYKWVASGTPRAPQDFTLELIPGSLTGAGQSEGANPKTWTYYLIGKYDAIVEIGDTWEDGDSSYRVIAIMPKNDYEKRCVVVGTGSEPNYG